MAWVFALSPEALPEWDAQVPPPALPLFDSSLWFATVLAVLRNQVLRLGARGSADTQVVEGLE